ncbi:unnamed protein product [Ambrosiozyma monospora]|uniref:Unnamed protein product n=1 Tax=Ambrosiozyma monospora TaxID=43982 RepID=A0ACB5TMH0_AMBMO|nr:unnamed protein product [Ambrosiozyma monospora]
MISSPLFRNTSLASEAGDEQQFLQQQQQQAQQQPISQPPSAHLTSTPRFGSPIPRNSLKKASLSSETSNSASPALRLINKSFSKAMCDFSPSSSDTEEISSAISRVHKRKESRRMRASSSTSTATRDDMSTGLQRMSINNMFDVLLCEPIPIHRFSMENNLRKLGCDVVSIASGSELIKRASSTVKFDLILTSTDLHKLDCIDLIKLIKNTSSVNSTTKIVGLTTYAQDAKASGVFDFVLEYPITLEKLKKILEDFKRVKQEEVIVTDTE